MPDPAPTEPHDPHALAFKDSSNIRSARLDPASGVVEVHFANGTSYRYAHFTAELLKEWGEAKSAGQWFHVNVKSRPDEHPVVPAGEAPPAKPAPKPAPPPAAAATPPPAPKPRAIVQPPKAKAAEPARRAKWWKTAPWRKPKAVAQKVAPPAAAKP